MASYSWEELRRQARCLENEIDSRLANFSALSNKSIDSTAYKSQIGGNVLPPHRGVSGLNDQSDLFNTTPQGEDPSKLAITIEQLLQKLTQVNDQMTELVREADRSSTIDGSTRPSAYRETSMNNGDRTLSTIGTGNHRGQSTATRILLEEQDKYHRSNRMVDDHLTAASTIRATLRAQRVALRNASGGLHNLTARFPRIRQMISKIDWRHRQDSIILGLVIACCIAFLLIYKLS
ncbi:golgi SNAP receptor complex member 1 [Paragonimus westermani]|uniref:Golgi SNAP receptor complex member 1 n=1 Tax=Paragonimus westermani TaxID=34504 RepID=A0A5J4NAT1_9TREM|nr:golgi SNAP receptor complex member 1 [Paragonimus westermani]